MQSKESDMTLYTYYLPLAALAGGAAALVLGVAGFIVVYGVLAYLGVSCDALSPVASV